MKKVVINILASTGIILLVLSIVAMMYGGKAICINTIFEVTMLSAFMHLGFLVLHRFDIQNPILEILIDISYTMAITLMAGSFFHWFQSTPIWVLILMVFVIYLVGYLIDLYRTKEEVRIINELLQSRKKDMSNE